MLSDDCRNNVEADTLVNSLRGKGRRLRSSDAEAANDKGSQRRDGGKKRVELPLQRESE
jgi:hypothetical protein